jgi:hypothetical protein
MKLTENTITAISAVLLIAVTCTVLLIGGLSISPVSGNEQNRVELASATRN